MSGSQGAVQSRRGLFARSGCLYRRWRGTARRQDRFRPWKVRWVRPLLNGMLR